MVDKFGHDWWPAAVLYRKLHAILKFQINMKHNMFLNLVLNSNGFGEFHCPRGLLITTIESQFVCAKDNNS